jgi:hypothetical protein
MKPIVRQMLWAALALLIGFVSGIGIGANVWLRWSLERMTLETAGNLSLRVEALSRARIGDVTGAVEVAEMNMDQAIRTLAQDQNMSGLPESAQRALGAAKVYRTVFPISAQADPLMADIIGKITPLPLEHCSPALRKVAEGAQPKPSPP